MPHKATEDADYTMADAKTTTVPDGDSPQLNTLRHLLLYPAVHDSVRAFRENSLGRMSIQLSSSAYQALAGTLAAVLTKPYTYVAPYVERADRLGDQTLSNLEEKFPVVKKPSPELLSEAREAVYAPVRHVSEVYHGTYERAAGKDGNGNGYAATGRAAVTTAAVITGQGLVYTLRGLLKWGESLKLTESITARVDSLEAAIGRQQEGQSNTDGQTAHQSKGSHA